MEAIKEKEHKSQSEFDKEEAELRAYIKKFCIKYKDIIVGFHVRHTSVKYPIE